ncbi:unnamed protein product [Calypogeia fissa]
MALSPQAPQEVSSIDRGKLENVSLMKVMRHNDGRRAMFAVVPTLTLGIIGGAVLPLAWAFSVTGVICGVLIMVVVAAANAYTSDLLLRQAYVTNTFDYENLASVIGGKWWRVVTEISIVILMVGSLVGGFVQIGEVGRTGFVAFSSNMPNWLVGSYGRVIIVAAVVLIVAPLCLVSQLRQLEYAGIIGTSIVLWLMFSVIINSISHGLPSLANKQLATVGFSSIGNVTQAVSIFGFAFYIQPIMMPMLLEVPDGSIGVKVVSYSTRITVLVNAFFIYFFTGFFGAAYYGQNTSSDILENQWLGGGVAQGCLNISMAVYLSLSSPVLEFPTRHTVNGWIPEGFLKGKKSRHVLVTTLILGVSLALALAFPSSSGEILTATGATGVCMVSYLIPVVNHLLLHYNRSTFQKEALAKVRAANESLHGTDLEVNSGEDSLSYRRDRENHYCWGVTVEYSRDVVLPLLVLVVGVFCSVSALSTL